MEVDFRFEVLEEAMAQLGWPEIFNTDQDSQFTSPRFTSLLQQAGVRVSADLTPSVPQPCNAIVGYTDGIGALQCSMWLCKQCNNASLHGKLQTTMEYGA